LATFDSSDKLKKAARAKQRRKKWRSQARATSTRRFNWQKSPRFVAMRQQEKLENAEKWGSGQNGKSVAG